MTEQQKMFGRCILSTMQDPEMALGVGLLLKEPSQMDAMAEYLQKNLPLTDEEILEKAIEIHQTIK